jgi:L-rhamnose isomerase
MIKALLIALIEPTAKLRALETAGDYTSRMALLEQCKILPFGAVYDYYCMRADMPTGAGFMSEVKAYEKNVLSKRA